MQSRDVKRGVEKKRKRRGVREEKRRKSREERAEKEEEHSDPVQWIFNGK